MTKRILNVVTNVGHYDDASHPTGLWLSELTHAWHVFEQHGFEQTIVSPEGGPSPLEPRSLKFPNYDKTARLARGWTLSHVDPATSLVPFRDEQADCRSPLRRVGGVRRRTRQRRD